MLKCGGRELGRVREEEVEGRGKEEVEMEDVVMKVERSLVDY